MNKYIILIALATCSLGVSVSGLSTVHYGFLIVGGLSGLLLECLKPLNKKLLNFLFLYQSPFIISLLVSLPINLFLKSQFHYFELDIVGRIIMLTASTFTIISIHSLVLSNKVSFDAVLKIYYFSCVLMVFSALWQALDYHTSFPISFPFETRTNVHGSQNVHLDKRLTGLAQEPSYLAPFLNEFLILTFLFAKNKAIKWGGICLGIILLFFTFSPSSYTSFLVLLMILLFYKVKSIYIYIIVPVITIIASFLTFGAIEALTYYNDRMAGVGDSGRFKVIIDALTLFFEESNFFKLLFGNGFKTFQIITTTPKLKYYMITSNNLFVDTLFECGIIGVGLLIYFFSYLFKSILTIKDKNLKLLSILLFTNLLLSSFYRADFTTLKFFIIIYIIFYISNYENYIKIKNLWI